LANKQIVAAKLHVLRLEPIKAKLGDRWERLSTLVHTLFERTLQEIQGPADHFLRLDDMSYVMSFHHLSEEEASLACAAVARKVCELLFGADIEEISMRGLVATVSSDLFETGSAAGLKISELLEHKGGEIIVRHPPNPAIASPATEKPTAGATPAPGERIAKAHDMARLARWDVGFFPIWDIQKRQSFSLYASLSSGTTNKSVITVRRALGGLEEARIVEMEIALLQATAEYALQLHCAHKVCVQGVGVSYETLSGFHTRMRYIGALKALQTWADCPLLIRIGPVPEGTPLGRIGEIVAMMHMPNVRVSLEFAAPRTLPQMDIRLGAAGIGGILPAGCDVGMAALVAQRLVRRAADQKCFAFLHGLDTPALLNAAKENAIRAGSGRAIGGGQFYTGLEPVPDFPLVADDSRRQVKAQLAH
jgi:hypothetical protein